jgi:basic membrane protein A and related proteins
LFLVVMMALAVAAARCGGDGGEEAAPPEETPPAEPAATAETGETAEEPAAGADISVGLVTDTGGVDDRGFNEFSINGLEQAAQDFGFQMRVYVSNAAEDYLPNLSSAAKDGHDLILAVGSNLRPDTLTVAEQYPDVQFAGVDHFYEEPLPNTRGMVYPTEEAGYLAGLVAALMTESGVVSTVGGEKIPSVDNWIAGFQQAVIDTNPDVELLNAYSDDFADRALCKEIALDHISQGADVVFQVAGKCGLGALDAACHEGVFAIGADADQAFVGDCILTSALKPLQESVYDVLESFVEETYETADNFFYGVAELPDAALLAPFSRDVPQEVEDAVAEAQANVASGEIDPPATLEEVQR